MVVLATVLGAAVLTSSPITSRPWMDSTLSPDKRVELLMAVMTVEEKVAQLGYGGCGDNNETIHRNPHGIGGCGVVGPPPVGPPPPPGVPATGGAYNTNELNRLLNASTRLGIPASIIAETTHSGGASGTTVFPMPCSQGASWNLSLVEEIGRINALQLRAAGGDQALSPILQVCTDPRFGRMEENFGEDPTLVAKYGVAAVTGLQGRDGLGGASEYIGDPKTHVASQAKHFAMYGAGPKDGYTPFGGGPNMRTVFEVYLKPWRDYAKAGGRGVMASHNMINYIPCHANKHMLTDVLRDRFGLDGGYIGSDNENVEFLANGYQGFASNVSDAAAISIAAGVDQDMPGASFLAITADDLTSGRVDKLALDRAVANVLRKKFASRLFDRLADTTMVQEIDSPEHRATARIAAEQGSVLLQNKNMTLPLDKAAVNKVAVIGPFGDGAIAQTAMLGGYSPGGVPRGGPVVTVAAAFKARGFSTSFHAGVSGGVGASVKEDLPGAVAAAVAADVAVVAIGTMACGCCKRCGNGEVGDRMSLEPEGQQLELLAAVLNATKGTKTKVVCVLIHGRPISFGTGAPDFTSPLDDLPALLSAWRPGEEGGSAIVNLLLGDANPSGKLAQAWQRSAGYIHTPTSPWFQIHSDMISGNYFGNGDDSPLSPLFPFSWGLSYTTFNFSSLSVDTGAIPAGPINGDALENLTITVKVTATNTGAVAGAVPVMAVYTKQTRGVVRNLRDLAAFTKIFLAPGASQVVQIPVRLCDLARYDETQP
jgi:beta-glucosidase